MNTYTKALMIRDPLHPKRNKKPSLQIKSDHSNHQVHDVKRRFTIRHRNSSNSFPQHVSLLLRGCPPRTLSICVWCTHCLLLKLTKPESDSPYPQHTSLSVSLPPSYHSGWEMLSSCGPGQCVCACVHVCANSQT